MAAGSLPTARLIAALVALALVFAPIFMVDGMAQAANMDISAMARDHCTGTTGDTGHGHHAPAGDCVAACLATHMALSTDLAAFDFGRPIDGDCASPLPVGRLAGQGPGLDPPPPRFS